jgi:hypothetical protein
VKVEEDGVIDSMWQLKASTKLKKRKIESRVSERSG